MITFAFIVITYGTDANAYVMDHGLSGEDCIALATEYQPTALVMGWTTQCEVEEAKQ